MDATYCVVIVVWALVSGIKYNYGTMCVKHPEEFLPVLEDI